MTILVTKRNGLVEPLNIEKIHKILTWATEGLSGVSISDIEANAKISFNNGITTDYIHKLLIESSNGLISVESPNYQYVASRLISYWLRKQVWGGSEPPRLYDHIYNSPCYDLDTINRYSESEIHKLGKYIKHDRDDLHTYAGMQQLMEKYLLKNRGTGQIYETPQFAYMLMSMCAFVNYPSETRIKYVKLAYDMISTFKINLPTPVLGGLRSKSRQYSSCILIKSDDTLKSIFSSGTAIGYYIADKAGIGLDVGDIRPVGSLIRNGEAVHTGLVPFLKYFQSCVNSCSQGGIRKGSATVNINFWHPEIQDIIQLKNNAGTDENRVRHMDYVVKFSRIFYERLIAGKNITLFCPHECRELADAFGKPEFEELYVKYENDPNIKNKTVISARSLAELWARERIETGRIYAMNIDNANNNSSFIEPVQMCNLCAEIVFPIKPLKHIDDEDAEIGVCVLSSINMIEVKEDELIDVADIIVRILDEVIDTQSYPVKAAENFCKKRRSLGVGLTNLAGELARRKLVYGSNEALEFVHQYAEKYQYALLTASVNLAREKGSCDKFAWTTYSTGILPMDRYKKTVDEIVSHTTTCDWDSLKANMLQFGLRHSTLTAVMPVESSSVVQNSTNGIEVPRDLISYKVSKAGGFKQVVPNVSTRAKYYTTAFSLPNNDGVIKTAAVIQKWIDMSISTNHYYNYNHYEGGEIPLSVVIKDMINSYKYGLKTLYYANTNDLDLGDGGCAGGACTL